MKFEKKNKVIKVDTEKKTENVEIPVPIKKETKPKKKYCMTSWFRTKNGDLVKPGTIFEIGEDDIKGTGLNKTAVVKYTDGNTYSFPMSMMNEVKEN